MNDVDRDLHDALGRLVEPQPPPLRSGEMLAAGRRARRRRTLRAGGGAVAGGVVVTAVAALVASATPAPHRPVPAATPTPAATRPIDATWPQPDVPGFSQPELTQIAIGCANAFTGDPGPRAEEWFNRVATVMLKGHSGGPEPAAELASDRSAPLLTSVVRVHYVLRDRIGTTALIYGPGVSLVCAVGGRVAPYNPNGGTALFSDTAWLSGPVSIEHHESQAFDPAARGWPATPAWDRVAGRAAPGVVRVTARLGPDSVTVPVVNGTYLANIVRGLHDWAIIPGDRKLTVTAYDAAGRALDPTSCVVDSSGKPYDPPPGKRCPKPVRWP